MASQVNGIKVGADNFVRTETDRTFADIQTAAGGINQLSHNREPADINNQKIIRLNRDTLYSFGVVDISEGAELTLPDSKGRYMSAMIINQDHYVNNVYHDAGTYTLTQDEFDTPFVMVAVRILADPNNAEDVKEVNDLQDQIEIASRSSTSFEPSEYDSGSLDATRSSLLELARGLDGLTNSFGKHEDLNMVHHLIATAAGWGGLPDREASYVGLEPKEEGDFHEITMEDVPVDAFWSISVYNASGFFEPNSKNTYTINNITGTPNDDGSMTVRFTSDINKMDLPNTILTPENWNILIRLYRPRDEFFAKSWSVPELKVSSHL